MAKPYKKLRRKMSPKARKEAQKKAKAMMHEIEALGELREAREYSQVELAKKLKVSQANVSKIEQRTDVYLSTLRDYIEGMGGTLEIHATFPEGSVKITQFHDLDAHPD